MSFLRNYGYEKLNITYFGSQNSGLVILRLVFGQKLAIFLVVSENLTDVTSLQFEGKISIPEGEFYWHEDFSPICAQDVASL